MNVNTSNPHLYFPQLPENDLANLPLSKIIFSLMSRANEHLKANTQPEIKEIQNSLSQVILAEPTTLPKATVSLPGHYCSILFSKFLDTEKHLDNVPLKNALKHSVQLYVAILALDIKIERCADFALEEYIGAILCHRNQQLLIFINKTCSIVSSLRSDESTFLPFGWSHKKFPGHYSITKVSRLNSEDFSYTLLDPLIIQEFLNNSQQNHNSIQKKCKTISFKPLKFNQIEEIISVTLPLLSSHFFQTLTEKSIPQSESQTEKLINEMALKHFTMAYKDIPYEVSKEEIPYTATSCSVACVEIVIQHVKGVEKGSKLYKEFQNFTKEWKKSLN
ncbi:MAG: hypothetical protein Tsb0021_09080 [Chlamydiales bacterium]